MEYTLSTTWTVILIIGIIWELIWKAAALWRAAQDEHRVWFAVILLLNTLGVIPILYLLLHSSRSYKRERSSYENVIPIKG